MAKVQWANAIKVVSGALTKINKKSQHAADQRMVLATHRVAPSTSPDCQRIYIRDLEAISRTTDPSQDELAARERFAAVSRAVAARKKALATLATDQAAFLAQKDQPNGKKTFTSYLWSLELASYDQAHS